MTTAADASFLQGVTLPMQIASLGASLGVSGVVPHGGTGVVDGFTTHDSRPSGDPLVPLFYSTPFQTPAFFRDPVASSRAGTPFAEEAIFISTILHGAYADVSSGGFFKSNMLAIEDVRRTWSAQTHTENGRPYLAFMDLMRSGAISVHLASNKRFFGRDSSLKAATTSFRNAGSLFDIFTYDWGLRVHGAIAFELAAAASGKILEHANPGGRKYMNAKGRLVQTRWNAAEMWKKSMRGLEASAELYVTAGYAELYVAAGYRAAVNAELTEHHSSSLVDIYMSLATFFRNQGNPVEARAYRIRAAYALAKNVIATSGVRWNNWDEIVIDTLAAIAADEGVNDEHRATAEDLITEARKLAG